MSVYIAGACSVPSCPNEPPKDSNPFCQDHWTRLPGRLRRRLSTVWKSRTKGHHGKVVKGHDWSKAIAAGVRYFGVLPRNELPREELEADRQVMARHTELVLRAGREPAGEIAADALAVHRQLNQKEQPMATADTVVFGKPVEADGFIHAGGKRYTPDGYRRWQEGLRRGTATMKANYARRVQAAGEAPPPAAANGHGTGRYRMPRRAIKLMHNGAPNADVVGAFREYLLDRYMHDLPKPTPEEIYAAGMVAGIERARAMR